MPLNLIMETLTKLPDTALHSINLCFALAKDNFVLCNALSGNANIVKNLPLHNKKASETGAKADTVPSGGRGGKALGHQGVRGYIEQEY